MAASSADGGGAAGLGVLGGWGRVVAGAHRRGARRGAARLGWGCSGVGARCGGGSPVWARRGAARPGGVAGLGRGRAVGGVSLAASAPGSHAAGLGVAQGRGSRRRGARRGAARPGWGVLGGVGAQVAGARRGRGGVALAALAAGEARRASWVLGAGSCRRGRAVGAARPGWGLLGGGGARCGGSPAWARQSVVGRRWPAGEARRASGQSRRLGSYGKVARITHDLEGMIPIGCLYDGRKNECLLESVKGCIALFAENEGDFLGKQIPMGLYMGRAARGGLAHEIKSRRARHRSG
ncbi:uncharacterized protein [Miscanthus floridulus]|uniref:uncharacterized protein n=1 Tax=Miscanthus floridulus TaxID=154761 RepID=UPI003459E1ED